MKKLFRFFGVCMLSLMLALSMIACDGANDDKDDDEDKGPQQIQLDNPYQKIVDAFAKSEAQDEFSYEILYSMDMLEMFGMAMESEVKFTKLDDDVYVYVSADIETAPMEFEGVATESMIVESEMELTYVDKTVYSRASMFSQGADEEDVDESFAKMIRDVEKEQFNEFFGVYFDEVMTTAGVEAMSEIVAALQTSTFKAYMDGTDYMIKTTDILGSTTTKITNDGYLRSFVYDYSSMGLYVSYVYNLDSFSVSAPNADDYDDVTGEESLEDIMGGIEGGEIGGDDIDPLTQPLNAIARGMQTSSQENDFSCELFYEMDLSDYYMMSNLQMTRIGNNVYLLNELQTQVSELDMYVVIEMTYLNDTLYLHYSVAMLGEEPFSDEYSIMIQNISETEFNEWFDVWFDTIDQSMSKMQDVLSVFVGLSIDAEREGDDYVIGSVVDDISIYATISEDGLLKNLNIDLSHYGMLIDYTFDFDDLVISAPNAGDFIDVTDSCTLYELLGDLVII